ncbi:MAG TPA: cell envelope integrity protein TolA [Gammaproteobacteria bacterium]|nr:cell envelope integrity protein TolA [Gammaproteobacteria bacterium]
MRQTERSPSEKLFWPVVWAVGLHAMLFAFLFVSFARTPELPPSRPVIKATLYQLQSQSQATTQTNQKIAGEAAKTSAPQHEVEQLEQKKIEQEKIAAAAQAVKAKAAEAKIAEAKAVEARKQTEQKAAQAKKQAQASKEDQAKKAAEKLKQAEVAKLKAAEDAKKKAAEDAKKKAADEAKKKAAEEAKKKATAEAAKKKAADEAKKKAEDDKKKRAAEEAAKQKNAQEAARKALENKKAGALAELLSEDTQYQQTVADTVGSQVAGNLDDLIIRLVSEQWVRPPSARNGMAVTVLIAMLPDGTITNASVVRSSGDPAFDASAVAAVRNVGRVREVQQLDSKTFNALYRSRRAVFKPEDLSL